MDGSPRFRSREDAPENFSGLGEVVDAYDADGGVEIGDVVGEGGVYIEVLEHVLGEDRVCGEFCRVEAQARDF